ncbi:MAG: carotenoid 1,2-hydratase [Acidocella sp.]|nr:carotenoid 1,2-hydratase [Acidocella sp.]
MFSPYYAWANRKSPADPAQHCAMNMVLYQPQGGYWAMTERGAGHLMRKADQFTLGPSTLRWDGHGLEAEISEICAPMPRRLRGHFRLTPGPLQSQPFDLDAAGRHRWQPLAPCARIEVKFDQPDLSWSGAAYFDTNDGDRPLAQDFSSWHWSRGGNKILYDVKRRDGTSHALSLCMATDGTAHHFTPPPPRDLPRTKWRVARQIRADEGAPVSVIKTLEDAPFYARSLISTSLRGERVTCVQESLDLDRFTKPWVQMMLPFRMPRRG